jgi:phage recombination protein Bet
MSLPAKFSSSQVALIRRTVAKDCTEAEFDWFLEICRALRLNPLQRQIYAFVFNKNDKDKRQLTPVVAIQGLRSIAERTGTYRPDNQKPRYDYDETLKGPTNPKGIVSCEVSVFKYAHGEWHETVAEAYWDEFVPLDGSGDKIAFGKDGWRKMPRLMIAKIAEAAALRKAWPDDFANVYEEAEVDRGEVADLTATEMADKADQEDRLAKIGGADAIMVDWLDGSPLDRVPLGQFADRLWAWLKENADAPNTVRAWRDRNRHSFNEFWARQKADALELKQEFERIEKENAAQIDLEQAIAEAG